MDQDVPPGVNLVKGLAALLQMAGGALAFAPWLLATAFRHFGLESVPADGWTRAGGVALFLVATVARLALPGGSRTSTRGRAWSELAATSGGPGVRWDEQGVTLELVRNSTGKGSASTRFSARCHLARDFRLSILPNNFLTRAVTSKRFVSFLQTSVRSQVASKAGAEGESIAREIAFLSGEPVVLGDPRFETSLLVKSDDPDLARRVLTEMGVPDRLYDLMTRRKGWTLSLGHASPGAEEAQLLLELAGSERDAAALEAGRALMQVLLASLVRNGVVTPAARTGADRRDARTA